MSRRIHILFLFIACVITNVVFTGCHTAHKSVASRSSKQPKFIDGVYLNGHDKTTVNANGIDPTRPKPKAQPPVPPKAEPADDDATDTIPNEVCTVDPPKKAYYSEKENNQIKKKYADLLGLKQKDITNYALYQFIDRWYGTNYRMGGCDRAGIDCSGFAQKLYGEVYGVDLLRTAMEQYSNCKRIKHAKDAEEGDLVFFHVHSRHRISHVGVYLANDYFVHASTSGGVMISNLNEDYWHKYFAGAGRLPKKG